LHAVDNETAPGDGDSGTVARHGTVLMARHSTGDSEAVTSMMIAAGISQLPVTAWTLNQAEEILTAVYLAMRKVKDL
jgi:hypothetical protein